MKHLERHLFDTRVQWDGLAEFQASLKRLPDELAGGVGPIVLRHARVAEQDIRAAYPVRTGNLREGMRTEMIAAGRFGAAARVVNRAPHSGIFESGTQARHTKIGANRGAMPPGNVFIPIAMRERRAMYEDIKDYLRAMGFVVTGEASDA